jgi:hypothetical protein
MSRAAGGALAKVERGEAVPRRGGTRFELGCASALLAGAVLLRLASIFHYRFDNDEPQHLHVVWAWTQGLVQYRDVFDNHMPLFHLLSAPLLWLVGVHSTTLFAMRAALLPVYALTLYAVHVLARALYGRTAARWAVVLTAVCPGFFLSSLEYRPDGLWTLVWTCALAVLASGAFTPRRALVAGVLLGAALGLSIKTVCMVGAVVLAAALVATSAGSLPDRSWRRFARPAIAAVIGFSAVPLTLGLFFAAHGALAASLEGTLVHNALPGLGLWGDHPLDVLGLFPAVVGVWVIGVWLMRRPGGDPRRARRVFLAAVTVLYLVLVLTLMPFIEWETLEPIFPPLSVQVAAALLWLGEQVGARWGLAAAAAMVGLAVTPVRNQLWQDQAQPEISLVGDVLRLTDESEFVMDWKGEAIFRRRPVRYAYEEVTRARMARGLILDDGPERMIATRTCVAVNEVRRFPDRARAYLEQNYLPVGRLRVAGRVLDASQRDPAGEIPFDVAIPARYALIGQSETPAGVLDGTPYDGARFLDAGPHGYAPGPGDARIAVIWAQAAERGFSPFRADR